MKVDILIGMQWGDEGKGKIVDALTPHYDIIARFQGGPNAGHSLEINTIKHVLHSIPSGIFHKDKLNIIGNGVVIDPVIFLDEINELKKLGIHNFDNIIISNKAHLILPSHRMLDAAAENAKGKTKIGSTLKGIGPAYMDKTGRNGLRAGDILLDQFKNKYDALTHKHQKLLEQYDYSYDLTEYEEKWFEGIELMRSFNIKNTEYIINDELNQNKSLLAEGAQGNMLDIDFGSYPFVTSSNTIAPGACKGLGVAPNKVNEILGIFKAYCTRVGGGPFPTELTNHEGEILQNEGDEYGATTGRARRCGWLDLVSLKYAVMLNGVTQLIMTKADVLNTFETIQVATAYRYGEEIIDYVPYQCDEHLTPIYKEFPGWKTNISEITSFDELPDPLKHYIDFIEQETNVPVTIISVGAERNQTIYKHKTPIAK